MPETKKALAIAALAENFGKELSEALLSMWLDLLAPYPAPLVEEAARRVVSRYAYKTMPPFAILRQAIDEAQGMDAGHARREAIGAWERVCAAISAFGPYRAPALDERSLRIVRLMGGWEAACSWERASLDFKRRDFLALWQEDGAHDIPALEATCAAAPA